MLSTGTYFLDRVRHYIPEMVRTRREMLEQERTLPPETLVEWKAACVAWEQDISKPNPFERTHTEITLASVRYQLAEEGGGIVRGDTDSSEMLAMGVKLEEEQ